MALASDALGLSFTFVSSGVTLPLISATAPGIDGGDAIPATLLSNAAYETFVPRTLKMITDCVFTFDASNFSWNTILGLVNNKQQIRFNLPEAFTLSSITIWGHLKDAIPGDGTPNERWTVTGTIVADNLNASGVETGPVAS